MRLAVDDGPVDGATVLQEPVTLLPLRFLGMGLWIVWQWATHWGATLYLPGIEASDVPFGVCDFTMRVADISTMVLVALLWRRLTPLLAHAGLFLLSAAAVSVGTFGMLMCINGFMPFVAVAVLSSVAAAFGGAILFLSWAEVYSCLAPERMLLMGVLSLVLAGCVSFLLNYLAAPLPCAGAVLVPVLSFVMCRLSQRYVTVGEPVLESLPAHVRFVFPWKPVAVMAFAGFVAGLGNFTLFNQTASTRMLATFVVGLIVLCVLRLSAGRVRLGHFAWAAFSLSLIGFVLMALIGTSNPTPAAFLIMVAYIGLCVVGLSLLGRLSFKGGIPSLWLFGLGRAASELMMGLGSYMRYVPGVGEMAGDRYALAVMAVMGIVCLIMVALLWRSEDSEVSNWAVSMVDAQSGQRMVSQRDGLVAGCLSLAKEAGLTDREREVLELLVLGQSYQQVCQSLLLSMGTVKTHVRHIYGKLDVHSREEAVELTHSRF